MTNQDDTLIGAYIAQSNTTVSELMSYKEPDTFMCW